MKITYFIFLFFIFNLHFIQSRKKSMKKEQKNVYTCKRKDNFKEVCTIGKKIKRVKRNYNFYKNLRPEQYEKELKIWYKKVNKEDLDLDNPKTLNEKIQWLKLYDSTPIKTLLCDKYLVKNYIKEKIGEQYVIPLLKVWDSYKKITFNFLPNKFVLKANHGSSMNIIVYNKRKYKLKKIRKIAKKWMNINFAFQNGFELQYMNIKPRIMAEKYFDNNKGNLYDYKVYCFDGRVESIAFLSGIKKARRIAYFDSQWNRLKYTDTYPAFKKEIPKPKKLKEMIEISQTLSKGFPFVRVDLYVLNNGDIKFGEMTFTPDSGRIVFSPLKQNRIFGDMIKLPPKSPFTKKK